MIHFTRVRFCNMMSFGNSWTEINLDESKTTLVVGANGSGKSGALLDSLSFALFGKPFRKINKPQLVNTITNRDLLVECEFKTPAHSYLVRRGAKPNVFEVYCDGKLVEPPADLRDYQEWLEGSVLRFNHKMFSQVVVLGSATYVPFMLLPASSRREVIEGILDIGVFSTMNSLLRERVDANKSEVANWEAQLRDVESQIQLNARHVESMRQDVASHIRQRRETVERSEAETAALAETAISLMEKIEKLRAREGEMAGNRTARDEERAAMSALRHRATETQREIDLLTHSASCPTCKRDIDVEFREARVRTLGEELREITRDATIRHARLCEIDTAIADGEAVAREASLLSSELERMGASAREKMRFSQQLREEIERLEKRSEVILTGGDIGQELDERKAAVGATLARVRHEAGVLSAASALLRDGGVKSRVIKQYVPMLNALIAKYLAALDFFVEFTLDENFSETIRSRYRDTFSYESFSEGEKCRINLALLFAWRAVARMRNSVHCNIIVMDEILDGSLDAVGAEEFIKIISALTEGENVFVISHRKDNLIDKFERTLEFSKTKNFSSLSVAN